MIGSLLLLSALGLAVAAPPAPDAPAPDAPAPDAPAPDAPAQVLLAEEGGLLGAARVTRIELHPEYHRYHLRLGEQDLAPVELAKPPPGRPGLCPAHGLTLYPRWDLAGETREDPWIQGERAPATPEEEVHAALCARLQERGAGLVLGRIPAGADPAVDPRDLDPGMASLPMGPAPRSWLHPVIGATVLLALGLMFRSLRSLTGAGWRDLALVSASAVLVRLWLSPAILFNGDLASYEKVVLAWGFQRSPDIYGPGWPALMGPVHSLFGLQPQVLLSTNLAFACLAPALLWAALRPLAGDPAARLGGLLLAILPAHVFLSRTEEMSIPVLSLLLLAFASAVRAPRGAPWGLLAGLSAGLASQVRPEALLVLPALALAPVAASGRAALRRPGPWLALLAGGVLVGQRLASLPAPREGGPLRVDVLAQPGWWLDAFLPAFQDHTPPIHLALDAAWTSPLLWLGALVALALGPRLPLLPWLVWIAGGFVLLSKSWPLADAVRLQLLVAPAWVALGAIGLSGLRARLPRPALVELGLVILCALSLATGRLDLARHAEWTFLAQAVPRLPAGAEVWVDGQPSRSPDLATVLLSLQPGLRVARTGMGEPQDGALLYVGTSCLEEPIHVPLPVEGCRALRRSCQLEPVEETAVMARTDLDSRYPAEVLLDRKAAMVAIGFYRMRACRAQETLSPLGSAP